MSTVSVPDAVQPRIEPDKYMRNDDAVAPFAQNAIATAANQVLLQRTKELFSSPGAVAASGAIPDSIAGSTRARFRFAGHTSPQLDYLAFEVLVARYNDDPAAAPIARLQIYDSSNTTLLGSVDLHYHGAAVTDAPNEFIELAGQVACTAGTEIVGVISDVDGARIAHAVVYEVPLEPDTDNGYAAANVGNGTPILAGQRGDIASQMTDQWKFGAAAVLAFNTDISTTSSTDKNIVDNSSTTITTATPGFTLDMRYKNRLSKTTVPVRMRVYGGCSTPGGGRVRLKDSSGTTVLEVAGFGTGGWHTIDGNLPATLAKYDLLMGVGGGATLTVEAVSIYELDDVARDDTIDTTIPIGDFGISATGIVKVKGALAKTIDPVTLVATGAAPTFNVTVSAPGSAAHGSSFTASAAFTAAPTGQTSASVRLQVSGVFVEDATNLGIVDSEPAWNDSFPTADGWIINTDWASNGSHGWYCILTNPAIGTSGTIASFDVHVRNDALAVGATITIENDYAGSSATASATSPAHFVNVTVT